MNIPIKPDVIDTGNYEDLSLFIDGKFIKGGGRKEEDVVNPATGQVFAKLPHATTEDLDNALASAQRAFESWRHSSPQERAVVLSRVGQLSRENAQAVGRNITLDMGKTVAEGAGEVVACSEHCDWHAGECMRIYGRVIQPRNPHVRQMVLREPVGVCAAFTPWNFPYNQAIRKISAAIGAGCSIIIKGPEDAPSAMIAIARMFQQAGLPDGVLNVVWGAPSEISEYLIKSPVVRKISFTGSVPVGKHLAALAGGEMKRATMELGGHSPVIVFEDADIERAISIMGSFKYRNAGQVCVAPTRFYVHKNIYDRFVADFVDYTNKVKVGNGLDPESSMGPLAHDRRLPVMEDFIGDAVDRGAKIEVGGNRIGEVGNFFSPTVVTDVPDDSKLMTEEPFGPIAPITSFSDTDEVLKRANSLPFGLAAFGFTRSTKTALAFQNGIESGMVNVNHVGHALAETPFGGVKDSGIGSEGGAETFESYLTTKFVTQLD